MLRDVSQEVSWVKAWRAIINWSFTGGGDHELLLVQLLRAGSGMPESQFKGLEVGQLLDLFDPLETPTLGEEPSDEMMERNRQVLSSTLVRYRQPLAPV